jgi:preprotein translocase subunit SecG
MLCLKIGINKVELQKQSNVCPALFSAAVKDNLGLVRLSVNLLLVFLANTCVLSNTCSKTPSPAASEIKQQNNYE